MLGPGVLALQEALDVCRNLLTLAGEILTLDKFLCGRDPVPAGALRDIHASVGHTNDVLNDEAVHAKADHAQSAGNVMLTHHSIADHPLAEQPGHHLSLFRPGFRHTD